MKMKFSVVWQCMVAWMLAAPISAGQLHIIAGTPTPNSTTAYALGLFRVGPEGIVKRVTDLVPKDVGAEWVGISYDRRQALVYTKDETAIVLDLDKGGVAKRCELPRVPAYLITQFLADVPGRGLTFEWFRSGPPPTGERLQGMVLDPATSCERSYVAVAPTEERFVTADGGGGVGYFLCCDSGVVYSFIDSGGNLRGAVYGDSETPWGYKVPSEFVTGDNYNTGVVVNDSKVLIILTKTRPDHPSTLLAFRKRDKTWHVIPPHHGEWTVMRGFGEYIATVETRPKKAVPAKNTYTLEDLMEMETAGAATPGIKEWRTAMGKKDSENLPGCSKFGCESEYGPDMDVSFSATNDLFPGRLHLFNIETEKTYMIETRQGDSEILLVENDTVYYRVSDRLYSAPITDTGIGAAKQIAKNEIIRDAHYAFMTRQEVK
ncbi:MAG TPA: hypothetical protein VGL72_28735 [Bryobacteraceae bacterium]|jgi:hypothetical protein